MTAIKPMINIAVAVDDANASKPSSMKSSSGSSSCASLSSDTRSFQVLLLYGLLNFVLTSL